MIAMRLISFSLLFLVMSSCTRNNDAVKNTTIVNAFVPIYMQLTDVENIKTEPATATVKAGKIYAYGNFIYQNDQYKGFHIIDNSNPANAQKVAFLKVPFSTEIAIKRSFLYCNNVSDLVVFNISNPISPVLVKRVKNAFPLIDQTYPPVTNTYFECVDNSKGVIVGREQKAIPAPNCRR